MLYFSTNAGIGVAAVFPIRSIYFKIKGQKEITVKADFIELVQENPSSFRLPGSEEETAKYYYGYKNLRWLKRKVDLTDLMYLKSQKNLRTDVPGSCIIIDPESEEKIKAVELIAAFNDYVTSNPKNRHNMYLTFRNQRKMIKPLGNTLWDEVEQKKEEITEKIKQSWGGTKEPSPRSTELAWIGLAYCYEFGVVNNLIPRNPFKNLLPQKPRTGSYLD